MKMALQNRGYHGIVSQRKSSLTPLPIISIQVIMIAPNWVWISILLCLLRNYSFCFHKIFKSFLTPQGGSRDCAVRCTEEVKNA